MLIGPAGVGVGGETGPTGGGEAADGLVVSIRGRGGIRILGSGSRCRFKSNSNEATCFNRVLTCASTANIRTSMLGRILVLGTVTSVFRRFWNPGRDANVGTTTSTTDVAINTLDENERHGTQFTSFPASGLRFYSILRRSRHSPALRCCGLRL